MTSFEIVPINEDPLDVGTRIHWDESAQSLYYVDVPNCNVYRYDIRTGENIKAKVGNEPLPFMFPVEGSNSKFVAALGRKFVFVQWDGKSSEVSKVETIAEVDEGTDNRLNGAKVDPWGRLWAGTMGPAGPDGNIIKGRGSLYCLDKGTVKKLASCIGISNGLAWNAKSYKMYYIDTLDPVVYQYDITSCGSISNRKIIFDFKKANVEGLPDGLTIDSEGKLWVAAIHGSTLVRFDPNTGDVLDKVVFPTKQITALSFGGNGLDKLYVTTARIPVEGGVPPPPAGFTYVINNPGCTGLKDAKYKP